MRMNNYLFNRLHYRILSDIFGYNCQCTANRLHTPLYIGGVASSHLSSHNYSSHLNT